MKYISTRGNAPVLSFEQATLTGLARDGGLYLPESIPTLSADEIRALHGASYERAAFCIMRPFIGDAFTDDEFREIIALFRAGAMSPVIDRVVEASDAPSAYEHLESGEQFGKIVVRWSS